MLTVNIWLFRGSDEAWGHASVALENDYISWWPQSHGRVSSSFYDNVYYAPPILFRTFHDDCAPDIGEGQPPDHIVSIFGLDEMAISQWWRRLINTSLPWDTLDRNCSDVARTALSIGGGDKYAGLWSSNNLFWTPNKVLEYALDIKHGIEQNMPQLNVDNYSSQ